MSKCTLTVGRRLRRLSGPGETELSSAGTQQNEGYPGRGCAKVHPAAGGATSPTAVFVDKNPWTPAPCLRKSRGASRADLRADLRTSSEGGRSPNLRLDPHETRMDSQIVDSARLAQMVLGHWDVQWRAPEGWWRYSDHST